MPRIAARVVACLLVLVGGPWATGSARADDPGVHGDDGVDAYVGSGALLLPAGAGSAAQHQAAGCDDCEWRLTSVCVDGGLGRPFTGSGPCMSVARGCPALAEPLRAWLRTPGESWRDLGAVCIPPSGPVTVAELSSAVGARVLGALPALRPAREPERGAVAQLPVVFRTDQPGGVLAVDLDVLDRAVRVSATPAWTWTFGDGARLVTAHPGGRYPDMAVTHAYRRSAPFVVEVVARWSATFTVDGLGPFPVTEPVTQSALLRVVVGEDRASLVRASGRAGAPP